MINCDDVKENLTDILMSAKQGVCPTDVDDISDALTVIEQLRQRVQELEAQVPKWISVEDELPYEPKEVLGLLSSGTLRVLKYCQNNNIWMEAMSYERIYTVTNWMQPQPPKG